MKILSFYIGNLTGEDRVKFHQSLVNNGAKSLTFTNRLRDTTVSWLFYRPDKQRISTSDGSYNSLTSIPFYKQGPYEFIIVPKPE